MQHNWHSICQSPHTYVELLEKRRLFDGNPQLVRDINNNRYPLSNDDQIVVVGSTLYFTRDTVATGKELWKSDGTAGSTEMVADIRPGASASYPDNLTSFGGFLFFTADDGVNGTELWRSNGTATGTVRISNINTSGSSAPSQLTVAGSKLFFTAYSPSTGTELYETQGTLATTTLVMDISSGSASSSPEDLFYHNGTLYFSATDATAGRELWTSTGSTGATARVTDLAPGFATGIFRGFAPLPSGELVFIGSDAMHSGVPYKTDGTLGGTSMVRDFNMGSDGEMVASAGMVFVTSSSFGKGDRLMVTDGTSGGTKTLDYPPNSESSIERITDYGSVLLYQIYNRTAGELEIWKTDGTPTGGTMVRSINLAPLSSQAAPKMPFPIVDGKAFFSVHQDGVGNEPWLSDGTTSGTNRIEDLNPGISSSVFEEAHVAEMNGRMYFIANDGVVWNQLMKYNPSNGAINHLIDLVDPTDGSTPRNFALINGDLYFSADNGREGSEFWKINGSTGEATFTADIAPGPSPSHPAPFAPSGNIAYFGSDTLDNGYELWRTDGTRNGTYLVKDINPGSTDSFFGEIAATSTFAVFAARTASYGLEPWVTDGTDAGTMLLKNIATAGNDSYAQEFFAFNNEIYFLANDGSGYEIWKTNGTPAGTVMLKDINPNGGSTPTSQSWCIYNNELYFAANDGTNGMELWKTNGTANGTVMVADINPGAASSDPAGTIVHDGKLVFSAGTLTSGIEPWVSDGTALGTTLLKDVNSGTGSSLPQGFASSGNLLLFVANDGEHGNEGFRSLGTAATTALITDLNPGSGSSSWTDLTFANGRAFFFAYDGVHGNELFRTDGTAAGTVLVKDSMPGSASGVSMYNVETALIGSTLYFNAYTPEYGEELWSLDTTDITPPTIAGYTFAPTIAPAVQIEFSEALAPNTVQAGDLQVRNLDSSNNYAPLSAIRSGYNGVVTYVLPTNLPDGNYRFRVLAGSVSDAQGNVLATNEDITGPDIFILAADANRDRRVNTLDFNLLAAHFGGANKFFFQGDFDYSGDVTSVDFGILLAQYGKTLPAAASFAAAPGAFSMPAPSLFGGSSVFESEADLEPLPMD